MRGNNTQCGLEKAVVKGTRHNTATCRAQSDQYVQQPSKAGHWPVKEPRQAAAQSSSKTQAATRRLPFCSENPFIHSVNPPVSISKTGAGNEGVAVSRS